MKQPNASPPIPGTTRAFAGAYGYQVGDIPELDYKTVLVLQPTVKK